MIKNRKYDLVIVGGGVLGTFCAYHALKKGLNDTFEQKGMFLGNTYNGKLPPLRIDFMLVSPRFEVYTQHADKVDLSDHYPIFSTLL